MISFSAETSFELSNSQLTGAWLGSIISQEGYSEGEVSVVFCDDKYLFKLNVEFLNHDTLTDVIGFNYSLNNEIHGEIYISIDRVEDNAVEFSQAFETELLRVMAHGVLHFCGYNDKTDQESSLMRTKEDFYLNQLNDMPS
ncbi:MAG: rRNA maturation RNase YbeY [Flavobacteriaceae bacterium]|nr:rRNA maturation RNase YbeY [Flavobacteriaceae bacterium]